MEIQQPSSVGQATALFTGLTRKQVEDTIKRIFPYRAFDTNLHSKNTLAAISATGSLTDYREKEYIEAHRLLQGIITNPWNSIHDIDAGKADPFYYDSGISDIEDIIQRTIGHPTGSPDTHDPRYTFIENLMKMKMYQKGVDNEYSYDYMTNLFLSQVEKGSTYYQTQAMRQNEEMAQNTMNQLQSRPVLDHHTILKNTHINQGMIAPHKHRRREITINPTPTEQTNVRRAKLDDLHHRFTKHLHEADRKEWEYDSTVRDEPMNKKPRHAPWAPSDKELQQMLNRLNPTFRGRYGSAASVSSSYTPSSSSSSSSSSKASNKKSSVGTLEPLPKWVDTQTVTPDTQLTDAASVANNSQAGSATSYFVPEDLFGTFSQEGGSGNNSVHTRQSRQSTISGQSNKTTSLKKTENTPEQNEVEYGAGKATSIPVFLPENNIVEETPDLFGGGKSGTPFALPQMSLQQKKNLLTPTKRTPAPALKTPSPKKFAESGTQMTPPYLALSERFQNTMQQFERERPKRSDWLTDQAYENEVNFHERKMQKAIKEFQDGIRELDGDHE